MYETHIPWRVWSRPAPPSCSRWVFVGSDPTASRTAIVKLDRIKLIPNNNGLFANNLCSSRIKFIRTNNIKPQVRTHFDRGTASRRAIAMRVFVWVFCSFVRVLRHLHQLWLLIPTNTYFQNRGWIKLVSTKIEHISWDKSGCGWNHFLFVPPTSLLCFLDKPIQLRRIPQQNWRPDPLSTRLWTPPWDRRRNDVYPRVVCETAKEQS